MITKYQGILPNIKNCRQKSKKFYDKLKNGKINPPTSIATEIVEEHCKKYYKGNETIQISIGNFSRDKSLDTISKAVHKVVYAINSSIIDECFYDVFNRYFKVIQSATGRECYANVAIGTHSRVAIVHPDFKVIVHVPKSKLGCIALPFISRFEKYQLSVRDILEDKKKLTPWITYKTGDDAISQNIIKLVYEGCLHFIREVQASSQALEESNKVLTKQVEEKVQEIEKLDKNNKELTTQNLKILKKDNQNVLNVWKHIHFKESINKKCIGER